MSEHQHVIELNGKLYDAKTGKPIEADTKVDTLSPSEPVHKSKTVSIAVADGGKVAHSRASHAQAHRPGHAKTLIRRGLKKPSLLPEAVSGAIVEQQPSVEPEADSFSDDRLERAKHVPKSSKISRFSASTFRGHSFTKQASPLPVKLAPDHLKTAAANHNKVVKEKLVNKAIKEARSPSTHHKRVKHHRIAHKLGVSHRVVQVGSSALAILLIAGFFAYQNAANISLKVASSRAGFSAVMPGYQPSGFSMNGPVEYAPGQITLNFNSNSDSRNFHITQRVSNWNSEALVSNYLAANNKTYQAVDQNGRTVYIYDGSNATWVSGGIWYQIEGSSSLNSDQLLHIASSM